MLSKLIDGIRENFGHPVSLVRLLEEHSEIRVSLDAPAPSIAADSTVPWHELGRAHDPRRDLHEQGSLRGWRQRGKYDYGTFTLHRPEYAQIGQCEVVENWVCDITDVHGFAASKTNLRNFASTDQMVETNSRDMIDAITNEKLAQNLAHREIRIIHSAGSDCFRRYSWDGRVFLINSGGSHHFAAGKYIAARLPKAVELRGKLYMHSLNEAAIASLRRDYEMFVISDSPAISLGFHDAMEAFRATWLWHFMPRPYQNTKAILLPKAEHRSKLVADQLRKNGVTDLGQHLAKLARHRPRDVATTVSPAS
jgi:hypothetical protein